MRPVLFRAFGLQAASAPVFAGIAALVAYLYFRRRRGELRLSEDDFWLLMGGLALGVFAGSVLFYALAYGGGFARNLAHWNRSHDIAGGASMGTFAGAFAALAVFCRVRRVPFWPSADVLAAAAPLGLVFMRVGCLLNGCCHGRPTGLPWGIVFTGPSALPSALRGVPIHPTQVYEALAAMAIFLAVDRLGRARPGSGDAFFAFLALYGAARFLIEFARGGDLGVATPLGLTFAQWICAAAFLVAATRFARKAA